jgi:hypothetical protein
LSLSSPALVPIDYRIASGLPGDPVPPTQRREDIDEYISLALRHAVEVHPLVQIDAAPHDGVLMARVKHLRIGRRHDVDGEIVGADDTDLLVGEPAHAFEANAGGAVIKCGGVGAPA